MSGGEEDEEQQLKDELEKLDMDAEAIVEGMKEPVATEAVGSTSASARQPPPSSPARSAGGASAAGSSKARGATGKAASQPSSPAGAGTGLSQDSLVGDWAVEEMERRMNIVRRVMAKKIACEGKQQAKMAALNQRSLRARDLVNAKMELVQRQKEEVAKREEAQQKHLDRKYQEREDLIREIRRQEEEERRERFARAREREEKVVRRAAGRLEQVREVRQDKLNEKQMVEKPDSPRVNEAVLQRRMEIYETAHEVERREMERRQEQLDMKEKRLNEFVSEKQRKVEQEMLRRAEEKERRTQRTLERARQNVETRANKALQDLGMKEGANRKKEERLNERYAHKKGQDENRIKKIRQLEQQKDELLGEIQLEMEQHRNSMIRHHMQTVSVAVNRFLKLKKKREQE